VRTYNCNYFHVNRVISAKMAAVWIIFGGVCVLYLVILNLILVVNVSSTIATTAIGDEEDFTAKISSKESLRMGFQAMAEMSNDPSKVRELLNDMNDPKFIHEVHELMKDPSFQAEMAMIQNDPRVVAALQDPSIKRELATLQNDPILQKALKASASSSRHIEASDSMNGKSNALKGMLELQKLTSDPKSLAEAVEMLKDPEVMKEVQEMMKDPEFIAEMKRYTDNPDFKQSARKAAEDLESLVDDPVRLKQMEGLYKNSFKS